MIRLDTHVVVWLHARRIEHFSDRIKQLFESEQLVISPAVYLEMQYLFETRKISYAAEDIFTYLQRQIALAFSEIVFHSVAQKAAELSWTRDPFDRLIVADAALADAFLITRDREILEHYTKGLW